MPLPKDAAMPTQTNPCDQGIVKDQNGDSDDDEHGSGKLECNS